MVTSDGFFFWGKWGGIIRYETIGKGSADLCECEPEGGWEAVVELVMWFDIVLSGCFE